jgi:hypothetical protein
MAPVRKTTVLLALMAGALGLASAPALGADTIHAYSSSFDGTGSSAGAFASVDHLSINQKTGDVYVLDQGTGALDQFDASGTPLPFTDPSLRDPPRSPSGASMAIPTSPSTTRARRPKAGSTR